MKITSLRTSIVVLIALMALIFSSISIRAQVDSIFIPPACPDTFVPDFECINSRLLDPTNDCNENKCPGDPSKGNPDAFTTLISVFDSTLAIDTTDPFGVIAVLVNLALTTFLGLISLYAVVRGIYTGGIVRARSIDDGEIAEATATIQTLIGGFALAWGAIFIIQLVASVIGLGSLSDLVILEDDPGQGADNQIVIQ